MNIEIPTDKDGFILLQCSLCGEFFKLLAGDLNDESNMNFWCPYCGLNGKNYITQEVLDIGMKMANNEINKMLHNAFKDFERQTKNNKFNTFKCGKEPEKEIITPIKSKVDNLEIKKYKCCKAKAKIKAIAIEYGTYCPLCGGVDIG